MPSPTSRTLQQLRADGYTADICERRLYRFTTVDLFHAFDIVAVKADVQGVLAIQTTSSSNGASRWKKLVTSAEVRVWLLAGNRAELWTWHKSKRSGRWELTRRPLTLADLQADPGPARGPSDG